MRMTDADLILALRQRGFTDCADAIEAAERLKEKDKERSGVVTGNQPADERHGGGPILERQR